jgi:hypothetical protein
MTAKTTETITIPNTAANAVFDDDTVSFHPENELSEIPGFNNPETYGDPRQARSGRIPSIFMITRISDGKVFGAEFSEPADDNFYAESPFYPQTEGETEFREVQKKTRVITEEYVEFA